ncbi:MAG TPA: GNAT family N-acetyltransferase [Bradyrhizobium sp.]|nr:GNAT family N-acetyltransferase [Bradyrhizobium sp.]
MRWPIASSSIFANTVLAYGPSRSRAARLSSDLPGLSWARFSAPFTPCVEAGWRLAFEHWGHGYATEAARLALGYGFGPLGLTEIVSFTSATNRRSRAVMERLGMCRDPAEDFDYPSFPEGHPLRRHVLYRLDSDSYAGIG